MTGGLAFFPASSFSLARGTINHLHNKERWFETASVPSGETHVADRIGSGSGAFQASAGNDTWGSWLQMLGSNDTPDTLGSVKYDPHRIMIDTVQRANIPTFFQMGWGASGAAALAAGDYTEFVFQTGAAVQALPIDVLSRRIDAGTKLWGRVMVDGQVSGTVDFFFGIHEYSF